MMLAKNQQDLVIFFLCIQSKYYSIIVHPVFLCNHTEWDHPKATEVRVKTLLPSEKNRQQGGINTTF